MSTKKAVKKKSPRRSKKPSPGKSKSVQVSHQQFESLVESLIWSIEQLTHKLHRSLPEAQLAPVTGRRAAGRMAAAAGAGGGGAGSTAEQREELKQETRRVGTNGRLVITPDWNMERVYSLMLWERSFDITEIAPGDTFPDEMDAGVRRGLAGLINQFYYDDLLDPGQFGVDPADLAAASTPNRFYATVWAALAPWHRSPPN